MLNLTAGYLGDYPSDYIGSPVEFPDFHGRTVTGTLDGAAPIATGTSAALTVDGKEYGIFANTVVVVGD